MTEICLAEWTDFVLVGMDKQMHVSMISEDLQKVLDTLGHRVLYGKMKYIGFRTSLNKWFESYFQTENFCFVLMFFFLRVKH